jgi:protein-S-isoprenylcysteine O-methyltransferase Ste14
MTAFSHRVRQASATDWIGFSLFGILAIITLSKMPAAGILLLPTFAVEFVVAISFLIRHPLVASVRTARSRVSAYGGNFLLMLFAQVANDFFPHWLADTELPLLRAAGSGMWLVGSIWIAYALWHLRHAFSIEPEARCLITSGPYSAARHPIYVGYLVQYLGMWLLHPTLPFALALMGWCALITDRMRHEERVLESVFPEYAEYRQRVGGLFTIGPVARPVALPEPDRS